MSISKKRTVIYNNSSIVNREENKFMIEKIELIKTKLQLEEQNEYMTLYASAEGIVQLKHNSYQAAFSALKSNCGYYRQLWVYNKKLEGYTYVSEFEELE